MRSIWVHRIYKISPSSDSTPKPLTARTNYTKSRRFGQEGVVTQLTRSGRIELQAKGVLHPFKGCSLFSRSQSASRDHITNRPSSRRIKHQSLLITLHFFCPVYLIGLLSVKRIDQSAEAIFAKEYQSRM